MEINQTASLLQICDLSKQWPNLQAVHDLAMSDLLQINADCVVELAKRAEVKAKAEAEAKAKALADAERKMTEEERRAKTEDARPSTPARTEAHRRTLEGARAIPAETRRPEPNSLRRDFD